MKATVRKGFTLIEILIVVIILGILAAIVIPQFTNASKDAKEASARTLIQTIRSQVELYKLEQSDVPNLVTSWTPMLIKNATTLKGPYLQTKPVNPLVAATVGSKVVLATTVTAGVPNDATEAAGFIQEAIDTTTKKGGRIWLLDADKKPITN